ncbi:MAG: hypothetical protein DKT66_18610 [Candidatus Melainabacteria bacterium]|nr:MAG: hypothetical protein DKT66_18610 [Candidatus Melainabacteria bacterium]
MKFEKKTLAYLVIGILCLSFALSYFYKPQPPVRELVRASQEMPAGTQLPATGAAPMASRVANSFTLALVLVKSEFSEKNATGLEYLRVWAQENFQRDPSFLRPVTLKVPVEVHHSIIDSLFFNLFAGPVYILQARVMDLLASRIDDFHHSRAYLSFASDYYEAFGMDQESASLLARYQSERAKSSVNVILCAAFWLLVTAGGIISVFASPPAMRKSRGQWLLAYGWLLVALLYFVVGWMENLVAVMTSSVICGAIGLYLYKPFKIQVSEDSALSLKLVTPSPQFIAIVAWISVSLVAIRLITWIKTGTLFAPDPLTLLASSWSGDFLHEPVHAKKNIKNFVASIWLLYGFWTAYYVSYDPKTSAEVERTLDSLQPINK